MTEEEKKIESNNTKIVFTAILSVFIGAAFIFALIAYGIGIQQKLDSEQEKRQESERIVSIIGVEYETSQAYSYIIPNGPMTEEQSKKSYESHSLKTQDFSAGKDYIIIDSGDKLREVTSKVKADYTVDDNFFLTGSIIAVIAESSTIDGMGIRGVTRDAYYNLSIDTTLSKAPVTGADYTAGFVTFVKVANIQPDNVTVTFTEI